VKNKIVLREFLNSYFGFNKQQRNGLYVLCCISTCLLAIRIIYPYFIKPSAIQIENIALVEDEIDEKQNAASYSKTTEAKATLFPFDPNTVTQEELIKLGFREKTAQTFLKFRSKGWVFKRKEDVQKIYGISPKLYARIEPYILIKNISSRKKETVAKGISLVKKLELNSADSLSLTELKGVGASYAKRIMKYRSMLGGFTNIEQAKEIYGMTDDLYQLIAQQCNVNSSAIKKININTVDFKTLNKHPYISYELCKHIFNFKKNTPISDANLAEVVEDAELASKLRPYLEY
jgi:DNA uptake protein ComE-like DNA-binding protein